MKTTFKIHSDAAEVQQLLEALRLLLGQMQGKQVEIAVEVVPDADLLYADEALKKSLGQTPEVEFSAAEVAHISELFAASDFEAVQTFIAKHKPS